jgi:sugar O-acyltransferase (sialic acid O-acetyltransferase NeuD family)
MYLFGAGGHAKVIVDILEKHQIPVKGFIEDDPEKESVCRIPVVGTTGSYKSEWQPCIIAFEDNHIRKRIAEQFNIRYEKAIYPDAQIGENVRIDEGTVVMNDAIIHANTTVGKHVIFGNGCRVDQNCHIGDYVTIATDAVVSAGVTVSEGAFIGSGATISPNITIGSWAVIGEGAEVRCDVNHGETVPKDSNNCK